MRMLLSVIFPTEPFNALVHSGKAGQMLQNIMEELKPEAVYFTEQQGKRSVSSWSISRARRMCRRLPNRSFSNSMPFADSRSS
jgi:hypothetical protein